MATRKKQRTRKQRKKGLANVNLDQKRGTYRVTFSLPGHGQIKRRFKTEAAADHAAYQANTVLPHLHTGIKEAPQGLTKSEMVEWVLSGAKIDPRPARSVVDETTARLITRFKRLKESIEESSYITLCIHLEHLKRYLTETDLLYAPVTSITTDVLRDYQRWRVGRPLVFHKPITPPKTIVGPVTVNKETTSFRSLFGLGNPARNPCKSLERLAEDELPDFRTLPEIEALLARGVFSPEEEKAIRKARILTLEEIDALVDLGVGRAVHVPLAIAAYTGARKSEVARLTWADVDLKGLTITFTSKKQSRRKKTTRRRVPVHPSLLPILQAYLIKTGGRGYLFPGKKGPVSGSTLHDNLKRVLRASSFEGIGWHTLRHSMASNLARVGEDQRVINGILGHVSDAMAKRYRHLFPDQRVNAMTKLAAARSTGAA